MAQKKRAPKGDVLTLSPAELQRRVDRYLALLAQGGRELEGLVSLTSDERAHSNGKLRDGEADAMLATLDAADAHPSTFEALAARDHGKDAARFETGPARDDLERREILGPLQTALEKHAQLVADTRLRLGELAREVTGPAYAIAAVQAPFDKKLAAKLAPAVTFYGAPGQLRSKRLKKAKNAKKQAIHG